MAVTTFENFYTLVKNNIVYFQYQKSDTILNIKCTLVRDHIPGSDENLIRYDKSILYSDLYLNNWIGSDSDKLDIFRKMDQTEFTIPEWLKIYSTNYEMWVNIEIAKILSLEVVDS
jgi:hypothetical protein